MKEYSTYFFPPLAFWTEAWKNWSLKNSNDPTKTTLALFLACRAATSKVLDPTAIGN